MLTSTYYQFMMVSSYNSTLKFIICTVQQSVKRSKNSRVIQLLARELVSGKYEYVQY
jgi:hypothetical protein